MVRLHDIFASPDYMHASWVVGFLVDTHHKHGGISRGRRDDDFLSTTLQMSRRLLSSREDSSGLYNIVSTVLTPGNLSRVTAVRGVVLLCHTVEPLLTATPE